MAAVHAKKTSLLLVVIRGVVRVRESHRLAAKRRERVRREEDTLVLE